MTLREFLDLRLLWDNVRVEEFVPSSNGLGNCKELITMVRNYGVVRADKLIKAGLEEKYLDYQLTHIYASPDKFKSILVLERKCLQE